MTPQGLYRLKPASQRMVAPVADWLVRRRVPADFVTWLAVPVGAAGGIALAASEAVPWLLWLVPAAAAIRLALNLLDGMIARATGSAHPLGELWNELADRLADVLFIGGLALHPAIDPRLPLLAVVGAVLASYVGITAKAAGGRRQYGGVMSKPGRMGTLAIVAPVAFLTSDAWWLVLGCWMILIGAILTLAQRIRGARDELR
jgi:CDP-diacylglycerol--glycerol-3-phosphate 3-phosphatidyltransferase